MKCRLQIPLVTICLLLATLIKAQNVAVNNSSATPDPSAMLDISSPTKGLLIPRMSSAAITSVSNPAKGLLIYDSAVVAGLSQVL